MQNHTLKTLAAAKLDPEDMPPLLLMQLKLFGLEDRVELKHIVIDEAQDFSLFQFQVLKELAANASFSILGDLCQGIYAHKGVRDWEDARRLFKISEYMTLEQSYRTTIEIMNAASQVISRLQSTVPLAKPVIRHGAEVILYIENNYNDLAKKIDSCLEDYTKKGYRSIAVIGKTMEECMKLQKLLKCKPPLITGQEEQFEGGLLILPSYLVKGLEFDAVLVANVSREMYYMEDLDIRLLYIAMTRALHELTLLSVGEPSVLVSGFLTGGKV